MSKSQAQESSIAEAECESRFECPICLTLLKDPVLTSCGHKFCRNCIHSWLEKGGVCPIDDIKLTPATDLFTDNFTKREILQQKTQCPFSSLGCTEKVTLPDLNEHIAVCTFRVSHMSLRYRCIFHEAGCVAQFRTKEELEEHTGKNTNYHLKLLYNVYSEMKGKNHTAADKSQETFFWDPPTKEQNNDGAEGGDSISNLMKALYEKIVLLEQKNREQDIIITNMSQQITMHSTKMNDMLLQHCQGVYLWTISDFSSKLKMMQDDPKKMYYSPGFYTSPYGYRLCIRMNLSPNNQQYLSFIIHVMKTDHDFTLDWPLQARITFNLLHPQAMDIGYLIFHKKLKELEYEFSKRVVKKVTVGGKSFIFLDAKEVYVHPMGEINTLMHIKETMYTNPDLEAFRRPSRNLNPRGFGYTEFVLAQDLAGQGYLRDNQLYIKVNVCTI